MTAPARRTLIGGGAVAVGKRALLILGPSGSGKSSLALEMISRGARLVSDDQTALETVDGVLLASPPGPIEGRIEARGVGLIGVEHARRVPVTLAVDLGRETAERLPGWQDVSFLGVRIDLVEGKDNPVLAAVLMVLMQGQRIA